MAPTAVTAPASTRPFKRRRDSNELLDVLNPPAADNSMGPPPVPVDTAAGPTPAPPSNATAGQLPVPTVEADEDDDYVPYVPLAKRRANLLGALSSKRASTHEKQREKTEDELKREAEEEARAAEEAEERRRERARKERTLLEEAQEVKKRRAEEGAAISSA
jgi:ATP-dependent RNA helicase DDX41